MSTEPVVAAPAERIDDVLDLFERWGTRHYDEELSQLDHALQTAALAVSEGADDELIAAALLHDVGHLLDLARTAEGGGDTSAEGGDTSAGGGDTSDWTPRTLDLRHEAVGARHLSRLFGPGVTAPIALHVRAKRYRSAVDPAYHATLSDGSRRSLELQGGPMDAEEVAAFEGNPAFAAAVALRRWDDGGKVEGLHVPELASYRPLLGRITHA